MRKFIRTALISAAIGLAVGLIFTAVALFSVNFDIRNLDLCGEPQKITRECHSLDTLKEIDINLFNTDIRVKESPDEKIHVTYYTTDCCSKSFTDGYGQISLHEKGNSWIHSIKQYTKGIFHGAKQWGLETVIEIPSTQMKETDTLDSYLQSLSDNSLTINLKTSNGNIIVEKSMYAAVLNVQTSNGFISLSDTYTHTLYANTSNGDLIFNNVFGYTANAQTSNGRIDLENSKYTDMALITSNGDINIKNTNLSILKVNTSNGAITLSDIQADKQLSADTSNGDIQFKDIKAENMIFDTSNGSISGNIIGQPTDYFIKSDTSLGNDSLAVYNEQNPNTNRSLEAYTSNGDINVTFSE